MVNKLKQVMAQFIDKDAVVAEIRRMIKNSELYIEHHRDNNDRLRYSFEHQRLAMCGLLSFIDNLEVKEVDFDSDIRTYLTNHFNIYEDGILQSKKSGLPLSTYDVINVAKHFFELGLKAAQKEG